MTQYQTYLLLLALLLLSFLLLSDLCQTLLLPFKLRFQLTFIRHDATTVNKQCVKSSSFWSPYEDNQRMISSWVNSDAPLVQLLCVCTVHGQIPAVLSISWCSQLQHHLTSATSRYVPRRDQPMESSTSSIVQLFGLFAFRRNQHC